MQQKLALIAHTCVYRKLSLSVHPDKCGHEKAAAAFEVIGEAQKFIMDPDRREILMRVLEYAREAVREVRRNATKNDSAVRMAAALNAEGREGVEKEWEETDDFHEKWRIKSQDVLARSEFRRRKLLKRYVSFPHRCSPGSWKFCMHKGNLIASSLSVSVSFVAQCNL